MRWALREVVDGALLVEFPDAPEEQANSAAAAIGRDLAVNRISGVQDAVPGARTLLVLFDPLTLQRTRLSELISEPASDAPTPGRTVTMPVRYGGARGPDLDGLALSTGMSPDEFARLHRSALYRVAFIGFAPGFPYLTGLPEPLHAPRLASPRPRVPSGSLGIGGKYTGVYPSSTPGGWRLIGNAPFRLFSAGASPPATLAPGDRVRFEEVDETQFSALSKELAGEQPVTVRRSGLPVGRILSAGLCTSVQGAPVLGLAASGVPSGGAMDIGALWRGNRPLGNPGHASALEITLLGPTIELIQSARLCLSGSAADAAINGRAISMGKVVEARAGDQLSIGSTRDGARSYLCIEGGFANPAALGEPLRRLDRGNELWREDSGVAGPAGFEHVAQAPSGPAGTLRVVLGPQADHFSSAGKAVFLSGEYRVSAQSDRRGVRLEGPAIELFSPSDIPPEGTAAGAIQVPANGQPIILGPDRPVTGGYAKIATVIAADLPLIAQARPGATLRFRQVSISEAVAARTS